MAEKRKFKPSPLKIQVPVEATDLPNDIESTEDSLIGLVHEYHSQSSS
jgi:hypothetical protein